MEPPGPPTGARRFGRGGGHYTVRDLMPPLNPLDGHTKAASPADDANDAAPAARDDFLSVRTINPLYGHQTAVAPAAAPADVHAGAAGYSSRRRTVSQRLSVEIGKRIENLKKNATCYKVLSVLLFLLVISLIAILTTQLTAKVDSFSTSVTKLPSAGYDEFAHPNSKQPALLQPVLQPVLQNDQGVTLRTAGPNLVINASSPFSAPSTASGRRLQSALGMSSQGYYHPHRIISHGFLGRPLEDGVEWAQARVLSSGLSAADLHSLRARALSKTPGDGLAPVASGIPQRPYSPLSCISLVSQADVLKICRVVQEGHSSVNVLVPHTTASGEQQMISSSIKSDGSSAVGCAEALAGRVPPSGVQITYLPDALHYTYPTDGSPKANVIDCPDFDIDMDPDALCCVSTPSMLNIVFHSSSPSPNVSSASSSTPAAPLSSSDGSCTSPTCAPCLCSSSLSPSLSAPPTMPPTRLPSGSAGDGRYFHRCCREQATKCQRLHLTVTGPFTVCVCLKTPFVLGSIFAVRNCFKSLGLCRLYGLWRC
jgi:hypothetical protein